MRSRVRHPIIRNKEPKGPGTPRGRFNRLMDELEERFPVPFEFQLSSSFSSERYFLKMIDEDRQSMHTALQAAITALDDWTSVYASEQCNPERVAEAQERIGRVGTIAYIAGVVTQCRRALNQDLANDQDSNEDR